MILNNMKNLFSIFCFSILFTSVFAQPGSGSGGRMPEGNGTVFGKVIEAKTGMAAEYAKVILYTFKDSALVTGVMTDRKGEFLFEDVPFGKYHIVADFIGYETSSQEIMINPKNQNVEVPVFKLSAASVDVDEVVVDADYAQVEYKIDKKVVTVSQDLVSSGGTAADVLENVPSVAVDIDGNVTMRGSGNFTVLINGKPSVLDANDALQQIPASNIKNIELITNPSAKYDPEGTAGIINIITKKKEDDGLSGVFNAGIGLRDKYNADATLAWRKNGLTLTTGFNYRMETNMGSIESERITYGETSDFNFESEGSMGRKRGGYSGNFGIAYDFNNHTSTSLSAKSGLFVFSMLGDIKSKEYTTPATSELFHLSETDKPREKEYLALTYTFQHKFDYKGHQLDASVNWQQRGGYNQQITEEWTTDAAWTKIADSYYKITESEDENQAEIEAKIDYTLPFGSKGKFETGAQASLDHDMEDFTFLSEYADPELTTLEYSFENSMDFVRNIYAGYGTFSNEFWGLGFQLGLRGEYTDRRIYDKELDTWYEIGRPDFFPTLHVSKEIAGGNKFQASYTRRINRPNGYNLEPFQTYMNRYNVRYGNPELEPEYIDSYELNWQKRILGASFVSLETFYRKTTNIITHLHNPSPEVPNLVLHTFENMNYDQSVGAEFMANLMLGKKLNINLSGSGYFYGIYGEIAGETIDSETFTWRLNSNTTYKLFPTTRLQLMLGYNGPSITAQGTSEGFLMNSIGIRQDLFKKKANITLNVRNFLGTMRHEETFENAVYYEHMVRNFEFPMAQVNFTFYLNQKPDKSDKKRDENGGYEGGED